MLAPPVKCSLFLLMILPAGNEKFSVSCMRDKRQILHKIQKLSYNVLQKIKFGFSQEKHSEVKQPHFGHRATYVDSSSPLSLEPLGRPFCSAKISLPSWSFVNNQQTRENPGAALQTSTYSGIQLSHPLPHLPLRRHQTIMIKYNTQSHKIDNVTQVQDILNPEGFLSFVFGSKVSTILIKQANGLFQHDTNFCLVKQAYCAQWWSCIGEGLLIRINKIAP